MMIAEPASETEQRGILKLIDTLRDRPGQQETIAALEAMLDAGSGKAANDVVWTPVFLTAGLRASFSLDEVRAAVKPVGGDTEPSPEDLSRLIDQSFAVAGLPDKAPARYVLNDKTRHAVVRDAQVRGNLTAALEATPETPDPATGVLNRLLRLWADGKAPPWTDGYLDKIPVLEMEDTVRAASLLADIWPALKLQRDEMRRRLDLEEVITPLRMLIGKISPVGAGGGKDTFVGREKELLRLYEHVGVVPPATLLQRVRRNVNELLETVTGAPAGALVVHAIGGMGKSALISKFVLDHAGESGLLFAYLDFDRSTLTRATTSALLIEVARQVGLQLEPRRFGADVAASARAQLAELRANLRRDLSDGAQQTSADRVKVLKQVVDTLPGAPRLLIVLDTVERLQAQDFSAIKPARDLLQELGLFSQDWDRLRVVGCSRIDAPELRDNRTSPEPIKLPALNGPEARELAEKMLRERHPSRIFAPELIAAISGASQGYPLFVRALVTHVGAARLEADADLINDLRSTRGKASRVATVFYARFADRIDLPGGVQTLKAALCLRVVTLPLFTAVLQGLGIELTREGIAQAVTRLRDDNTLWAEHEPDKLRWRPELRALLLGCIREEDTGGWLQRVAGIAFEAYRATTGNADDEAQADSLYYTLLAGKGVTAADRFWDPSDRFRQGLVDAGADFPPESIEARYIRLVAARRRPSTEDLEILPAAIGWQLSWRVTPSLAAPATGGIEPEIVKLLDLAGSLPTDLADLNARVVALLAKTGRWREARRRLNRSIIRRPVDRADLLNWMVRAIPSSGGETWDETLFPSEPISHRDLWDEKFFLDEFLANDGGSSRRNGIPAADGEKLVGALVMARIRREQHLFDEVDPMIGELHARRLRPETLATNAIMAGTFGDRAADWAVEVTYHARLLSAVSIRQLLMIRDALRTVRPKGGGNFETTLVKEALNAPDGIETARAWTESEIIRAVLDALWALRHDWPDDAARRAFFRSFFAVRNPDWIEPFAYAVANGHGELLRSATERLLAQKRLHAGAALMSSMRNLHDPTDMLRSLDEAGALDQCLAMVRQGLQQEQGVFSQLLEAIRFSRPPNASRDELVELIAAFESWQAEKNRLNPLTQESHAR